MIVCPVFRHYFQGAASCFICRKGMVDLKISVLCEMESNFIGILITQDDNSVLNTP